MKKITTDMNAIRNIALNIRKDISDNDYGEISKIEKNVECGYYLVEFTCGNYTFQSSHRIGKDLTNAG